SQPYDGVPKSVTVTTIPADLPVTITYAGADVAPTLPGTYEVEATVESGNYTGAAIGSLRISVTALVRRGLTLNGGIDGSVQVINAENATLNGQAWIADDLLMRGTPTVRLNGAPTYGGTLDATGAASPDDHLVTLNGRATLRHVVRRVDPIALPTVPVPS